MCTQLLYSLICLVVPSSMHRVKRTEVKSQNLPSPDPDLTTLDQPLGPRVVSLIFTHYASAGVIDRVLTSESIDHLYLINRVYRW